MSVRLSGPRIASAVFLVALAALGGCEGKPHVVAGQVIPADPDFNVDVRPILSDNCFRCHGPDAGSRKAKLRLDLAESAYAELPESKGKHAIVPGHPDRSELIRRITSSDPDVRMPPPATHKTLSPAQAAVLHNWIDQGAKYKAHWAYIPPVKPAPPKTRFDARARNPLDHFILARVEEAGLEPAPEADRETLINRVTLDLTGLPPTLAEVDRFLADKSDNAYEKVVDGLLASPRFGERMASQWMDVARYADTDGYLDDLNGRLLWPWRDWVISAFNRNMPYDQFVTWQLAGDLLPNPTSEQVLATAFGRLGKRSTENGIIDEEYRVEYVNERAELVGKAFLGLTVGCAKCHDHKYDTISQEDYYSLGAFFNNIDERGFYAAGYLQRTVGPTMQWLGANEKTQLDDARQALERAQTAYDQVTERASQKAEEGAKNLLGGSALQAQDKVLSALSAATMAYFPLDSSRAPSRSEVESLMWRRKLFLPPDSPLLRPRPGRPSGPPPPPKLPNGLVEHYLSASPSGKAGMPPMMLQEALLKPGKRGNAFEVSDHNIGILPRRVGWFERTQPFGFSLWLKLPDGKTYGNAPVVFHRDHNVLSGDSGYTLNLDANRLRFDLIHMSPHNMVSVRARQALKPSEWVQVTVTYDGSSRARGIRIYVNGVPADTDVLKDHLTRTILPTEVMGTLGGEFYGLQVGYRFRDEVLTGGLIDEVRVFDRELSPLEVLANVDAGRLRALPLDELKSGLKPLLLTQDTEVQAARAVLDAARTRVNELLSAAPEIMVMGDLETPRKAYLLTRGVYSEHGKEVSARGLDRVFAWDKSLPRNRLGLAHWLFDARNPLTARVTINRIWATHFGKGIVETVEDFGTQGSGPTHPALLDWLARELVQSHWDLKHMHKLMVMSATYRQSSDATRDLTEKDPRNLLYARANRQRLPAEVVRDNALAASGLLVGRIGGPSVFPWQPAGVWEGVASRNGYPVDVPDDDNHRRSLYTFIKRSAQAPSMVVFDFADRNVATVRRPISNTPLQALVLLNEPQYREAYAAMARQAAANTVDPAARITRIFRLATRRSPQPEELQVLSAYYSTEMHRPGMTPGTPAELAALTKIAAAVMNTPDAYSIR